MQDRDKHLKDLRPAIPTITEEAITSMEEQFQNPLLLKIFHQYILKRKGKFYQLSAEKKIEYIQTNIRNDLKFRNLLAGLVIGQFTLTEFDTYQSNKSELNRRIMSLIIQRLQDQSHEFTAITAA